MPIYTELEYHPRAFAFGSTLEQTSENFIYRTPMLVLKFYAEIFKNLCNLILSHSGFSLVRFRQ